MNNSSQISLGLIVLNSRVVMSFLKDSQKEHHAPLTAAVTGDYGSRDGEGGGPCELASGDDEEAATPREEMHGVAEVRCGCWGGWVTLEIGFWMCICMLCRESKI